ncbi:hypothetical protein D3C85_353970 [compost metagenome]
MSRCGSDENTCAPNFDSSPVQPSAPSYTLFQNIALPCARTPSAMKIGSRSTGKYGHGAASTLVSTLLVNGVCTFSGPLRMARDQPSACSICTPNLAKVRSMSGKLPGALLRTTTSPPVIAPSARKVVISWKSSSKRNSPPPSAPPPCTVSREVPMPSMRTPIMAMKRQNSCTCGSEAALVSVEVPPAAAAHSTKFSVVVTEA